MIEHQKVIESLNVTFDDTKLPSLQREKDSESLEIENLSEYNLGDEDEPGVASGNHVHNGSVNHEQSSGSVGNTTQSQSQTVSRQQSVTEPASSTGRLSRNASSNSGGDEEGSTSRSQHNYEEGQSSRTNLPRQRAWSRDHPFELIIGDPESGVRTRRATQNESLYSGFPIRGRT